MSYSREKSWREMSFLELLTTIGAGVVFVPLMLIFCVIGYFAGAFDDKNPRG